MSEPGKRCTRRKMGEYNWLRCALEEGHGGECAFAVDSEPYPLPPKREEGEKE